MKQIIVIGFDDYRSGQQMPAPKIVIPNSPEQDVLFTSERG